MRRRELKLETWVGLFAPCWFVGEEGREARPSGAGGGSRELKSLRDFERATHCTVPREEGGSEWGEWGLVSVARVHYASVTRVHLRPSIALRSEGRLAVGKYGACFEHVFYSLRDASVRWSRQPQ